MNRHKFGTAVAVLAILAFALVPGAVLAKKPAPPDPEPDPDPAILYMGSVGKGNSQTSGTMLMNADGSNQTAAPFDGFNAAWSPDGTKIAYHGWDEGSEQPAIFTVNLDGTGNTKVVNVGSIWGRPAWSPKSVPGLGDGNYRLAFTQRRWGEDYYDLYIVNLDGTDLTQLTTSTTRMEHDPDWSPDGTRLAFKVEDYEDQANDADLWGLYDFTTGTLSLLHQQGALEGKPINFPSWARTDPGKIAWSVYDGGNSDIWVVDLDDPTNPVRLTATTDTSERWPCWSPDDSEIVFSAFKTKGTYSESVRVMDADGSNVRTLAEADSYCPRWRR